MMKTLFKIVAICSMMAFAPIHSMGQSSDMDIYSETVRVGYEMKNVHTGKERRLPRRLISPNGDWQFGLSVMYSDFDAANSDYMFVLDGVGADASMFKIAPEVSITVADNHALGVRFTYTKLSGALDAASLDLLGNLNLSVGNINALSSSMGGSIYQRTFVGLDKMGRFGIFWDYVLGYTKSQTRFSLSPDSMSHTLKKKYSLSFAPGVVYYPMNNVSVQANISIFDVSYSRTSAYSDGTFTGERYGWKANASLNLLNLSFGLAIHL